MDEELCSAGQLRAGAEIFLQNELQRSNTLLASSFPGAEQSSREHRTGMGHVRSRRKRKRRCRRRRRRVPLCLPVCRPGKAGQSFCHALAAPGARGHLRAIQKQRTSKSSTLPCFAASQLLCCSQNPCHQMKGASDAAHPKFQKKEATLLFFPSL